MGGAVSSVVGGVANLAGGLIGGSKAADAAKGQAEALRAAADRASAMAAFTPYGMTTAFGTSKFEDGRGSYQLSPELKALQNRLFSQIGYGPQTSTTQVPQLPEGYSLTAPQTGLGTAYTAVQPKAGFTYAYSPTGERIEVPLVSQTTTTEGGQGYSPEEFIKQISPISGGASSLFNLGQQYLAQSPEQAAADYMAQQQGLLAGSREQQLASLRNQQLQTGRSGLATGGTSTGMAATNPEMAAYYNALAQQDRQLAAQATQAGMERTKFGAGLFGTGGELLGQVPKLTTAGYAPLEAQLGLLRTTEAMGQDPYKMSIDLANQYAQAGARQGQLYLQPQQQAANAYAQYQGYSPMSAALSGAGSALSSMGGGGGSSWFNSLIGSNVGTAARYGTNIGSQQTNMLQEQERGLW